MKKIIIARSVMLGLICTLMEAPLVAAAQQWPLSPLQNLPTQQETASPLSVSQEIIQTSTSLPTQKAQALPTQEEIKQQIAHIKKTIKQLDTINALATAAVVGAGAFAVVSTATIGILSLVISLFLPAYTTIGVTGFAALTSGQFLFAGMVAALVSETLGIATIAGASLLFGGLTAASMLTALAEAKELNALVISHPELFTTEQKNTLKQFSNLLKGILGQAIARGLQIKDLKKSVSSQALKENSQLAAQLGSAKNAQSIVESYIENAKTLHNLTLSQKNNREQRELLLVQRKQHKPLALKHTQINLKIANLDTLNFLLKPQISIAAKKAAQLEQKYPLLKTALTNAVQKFIQESENIINELKKGTDQTDSKK